MSFRLAEAFGLIAVAVSPAEVAQENAMLRQREMIIGRMMRAWGDKWFELSPVQRQVLETFVTLRTENPDGPTMEEIAAHVDLPTSEVFAQMNDALQQIKRTNDAVTPSGADESL